VCVQGVQCCKFPCKCCKFLGLFGWTNQSNQELKPLFAWRLLRLALSSAFLGARNHWKMPMKPARVVENCKMNHIFFEWRFARASLLQTLGLRGWGLMLPYAHGGLQSHIVSILQHGPYSPSLFGFIFAGCSSPLLEPSGGWSREMKRMLSSLPWCWACWSS
jgi:hypothetical protein